ncbi:MAG: transcription termination factor NusA [Candidatus Neomarinimicrobiota bacterium]|nr:transcription termination factor NusA [Candidatus Neomarinimicrobiota bacterium]
MINRALIDVFSEIAREKNVERSELGSIIEQLFLHLIERERGDSSNCSVIVNLDKGELEIYAEREIVDDLMDPVLEIILQDALKLAPGENFEVGDIFVEVIDPAIFGRRLVTAAKQFFSQRLNDVEKRYIYEDYSQRVGEIVIGTVRQIQRDNLYINIDQAELLMPRREQILSERHRRGDTIRAVVKSVEVTPRGPEIIISRTDNHFLYKLFEMEVPEIEDGIIEIDGIARQPGERAKIIVKSNDRRIDPVGACVGMRGSRIQAIVRELNNEKIDIVNYSHQPEILLSRALSPATPLDLYIDEDDKYCVAVFNDDDLEFAIGRGGVNINLASRITDYRIDAYGKKEYERNQKQQATLLSEIEDITKKDAALFENESILTVSDLLGAEEDTLLDIKGISSNKIEKIYNAIETFIESDNNEEVEEEVDVKELMEDLDEKLEAEVKEVAESEDSEEVSSNVSVEDE